MMSKILNVLIIIFLFLSVNTKKLKAEVSSPTKKSTSVIHHLFNKVSFDGWYKFIKDRGRNNDPSGVFTISDSLLRVFGKEWGCITTTSEYENYHLIVEFKWGEKTFTPRLGRARDSGVLLNSVGKDGAFGGAWMHSVECQLIEGGTGDFIVVGDSSDKFAITAPVAEKKQGKSYLFQLGGTLKTINYGRINRYGRNPNWQDIMGVQDKSNIEKPKGEWNKLECIVIDNSISIYLNGFLVNQVFDAKPHKGRIQIQSEGAEIFFRKIDLRYVK